MNIQNLTKGNYEIAKSKGFYPDDSKIEDHLMGIVSELGEAYEAHRQGFWSEGSAWESFEHDTTHCGFQGKDFIKAYKDYISGSFEDEIADVFIRLFNLCGFMEIYPIESRQELVKTKKSDPITDLLVLVDHTLNIRYEDHQTWAETFIHTLNIFCYTYNIPIEKHIQAKMEYNKTRPYLHNKEY